MASPPKDFVGDRSTSPSEPNLGKTLMGWNQLVAITGNPNLNLSNTALRVSDYSIGINQEGNAPDYITGSQDATAWTKGPIETQGDLSYPFTFGAGLGLFAAGAGLVFDPQESFSIQSSAHMRIDGCKINTVRVSCEAGGMIESSANVWGIASTINNDFDNVNPAFVTGGLSDLTAVSSGDGNDAARTLASGFGNPNGVLNEDSPHGGVFLEQIPQWDVVKIVGAPTSMHVVGFSLEINNRLVRNYTMGDETGASPFGLNAASITAQQRRVTGSLTWQSGAGVPGNEGNITQLVAAGLESLNITIYSDNNGASSVVGNEIDSIRMIMNNCLWNATPPRLSPADRVTVESGFTALGTGDPNQNGSGAEFDALQLILPGSSTPIGPS